MGMSPKSLIFKLLQYAFSCCHCLEKINCCHRTLSNSSLCADSNFFNAFASCCLYGASQSLHCLPSCSVFSTVYKAKSFSHWLSFLQKDLYSFSNGDGSWANLV